MILRLKPSYYEKWNLERQAEIFSTFYQITAVADIENHTIVVTSGLSDCLIIFQQEFQKIPEFMEMFIIENLPKKTLLM